MGIIEDIREWFAGLDEIDRKNLYVGIGFAVLILYTLYTLNNTASSLSHIFGRTAPIVNATISNLTK